MVGGDSCGVAGCNFSLKPSVGTWLQPLCHGGERMVVAVTNATVLSIERQSAFGQLASNLSASSRSEPCDERLAFVRRPSVGTWLQVRFDQIDEEHGDKQEEHIEHDKLCHDFKDKLRALEFADARAASWEADFGAFALCPPNHKSLVDDDFCDFTASLPEVVKCSDSTPIHDTETALCDNSPLGPFRLAPPPSPATTFSVGSVSPKKGVLIFEEGFSQCGGIALEISQSLPVRNETEVGLGMGDDDDEELLLGSDNSATDACFTVRNKSRPNDVDSDSESEAEAEAPALSPAERPGDCRSLETSSEPAARPTMALFLPSADIASKPPSHMPELDRKMAEAPETVTGSSTRCKADPPQTPVPQRSMKDVDSMLSESLDRFFGNDRLWGQVGREVALGTRTLGANLTSHASHFRVQVPKPYPGVQYRQSKSLDDRHPRFAENGSVIVGRVEDDGAWLRISDHIFLPMRVGAVCIMEPLPPDPKEEERLNADEHPAITDRSNARLCEATIGWWPCCSAQSNCGGKAETELVVEENELPSSLETHSVLHPKGCIPEKRPSVPVTDVKIPTVNELGTVHHGQQDQDGCVVAQSDRKPEPRPEACKAVNHDALSHVDAMCRHFSQPIDPFSDSDLGHTPGKMRMSLSPMPRRSPSTAGRSGKPDETAKAGGSARETAEGVSAVAVADVFEA